MKNEARIVRHNIHFGMNSDCSGILIIWNLMTLEVCKVACDDVITMMVAVDCLMLESCCDCD